MTWQSYRKDKIKENRHDIKTNRTVHADMENLTMQNSI